MKLYDLKSFISRWQWRIDTAKRFYMTIGLFVQFLILFKVYNFPTIANIIITVVAIILFLLFAWLLDKYKMIHALQETIWDKTPQWKTIKDELSEIKYEIVELNKKLNNGS